MRKTLLGSVASLAAALALLPLANPVDAAPLTHCGQRITHNLRLVNDLKNCPANGLVVGADHIVIDLAGHTIDGRNSAGSEGIADDGHRGVHIRNGVIRDFFANGVALRNAPNSGVQNLTIEQIGAGGTDGQTSAGVLVKDSRATAVTGNSISNAVSAFQSDGLDVLSSPDVLIAHNRITRNAWNGAFVLDSPRTQVLGNQLDHNVNQGMEINAGSDSVRVLGNVATGNLADGMAIGAVKNVVITGNIFRANGDTGLFFFDLLDSSVSGNSAAGNSVGLVLAAGQHGSTGNRIIINTASGNLSTGIVIDHAAGNTILANTANANQGQPGEGGGIIVVGASGNTLSRNVTNHNRDVGLGVFEDTPGDSAGNTLRRNTANFNGAHGIDAVVGTIDGGHNTASGNTPLPNCQGVVCS